MCLLTAFILKWKHVLRKRIDFSDTLLKFASVLGALVSKMHLLYISLRK